MRIAYVCADRGVPVFGHKGCSIHVQEVVRALAGAGASIDLFATRWDGDPPADWPASVRLHKLPFVFEDAPARREQHAMAVNPVLRETLQKHGPFDLVYERYSLWSY